MLSTKTMMAPKIHKFLKNLKVNNKEYLIIFNIFLFLHIFLRNEKYSIKEIKIYCL